MTQDWITFWTLAPSQETQQNTCACNTACRVKFSCSTINLQSQMGPPDLKTTTVWWPHVWHQAAQFAPEAGPCRALGEDHDWRCRRGNRHLTCSPCFVPLPSSMSTCLAHGFSPILPSRGQWAACHVYLTAAVLSCLGVVLRSTEVKTSCAALLLHCSAVISHSANRSSWVNKGE